MIGGKYHERILIEVDEKWLVSMGKAMELDLIGFFANYHGVYRLEGKHLAAVEKKLKKMEEVMGQKRAFASAEVKNLLISIIISMLYGAGTRCAEYHMPNGKMLRYAKAREIIQYIMEHYSEVYGLEDLAGIFYMDFKEVTNFTVNEFINCQRIGHARDMLLDESLSMEEISQKLGYERLSYFDRVFKKYVGMSPLQYRKSKRKKNEDEENQSI